MKKTLKAFFFILLILLLCFSLCACYATDEMNQRNGTLLTERLPKPGSLENYIVIRLNGEEWQLLAKNINGDTSLDRELPDETISKTGDSKILPDKVLLKTDERLPLKLGLFGRVKMWLFGNLGYWALLIIVAAGAGLTVLFVKVADMIRVKISDKSEEARKKRNNKA